MPGKNLLSRFQRTPAIEQPALLNSWLVWLALAAVFLIPFFLPIAQSLRRHPLIGALGEQLHIPLLACLMLLIYWKGPLRGRLWYSAATTAILGGVIEFVQILVGRTALFEDWLLDLVGIGLVVGFVLWRGQGRNWGKYLFIALVICIPAQLWNLPFSTMARYEAKMTFPVIADFDGKHFNWLWKENYKVEFDVVQGGPGHGQALRLSSGPPSSWPGARLTHFPEDWSNYSELVIDARMIRAAGDSLRFGVRIDDFEGRRDNVWAQQSFYATDQWQTFILPIANRKVRHGDRILDLGDVEALLVFVGLPKDSFALEIDNIRLQ